MKRTSLVKTLVMAAAAAAVSFGAVAAPSSPADAWVYSGVSGSAGGLSIPTIYVGDLYMPTGTTQFTLYSGTGPTAYRSAGATGAQTVNARYYVEQWNGSAWTRISQSPLLTRQIGATQSGVVFPAAYIQPTRARGTFRVTWGFDWYRSTGSLLGSTYVVANLTADHVCVTQTRLCQSGPGYFQTGLNRVTW